MKNYISVVIALLLMNFTFLNAQNKSGYNFGVNITATSLSYYGTKIKPQFPLGFHFGMNYDIPINKKIGFQTGFIFSSKGAEYKINNSDYLIDPDYIEIPINCVLNFGKKPSVNMSIFAGPYFSSAFSGYKIEPVGGSQRLAFGSGENKDLKYIDTGFNFGVNLNIRSFILSIQYGLGLRNLSPKNNTEIFNRVIGISFIQTRGNK
jgi:hypothetical protein